MDCVFAFSPACYLSWVCCLERLLCWSKQSAKCYRKQKSGESCKEYGVGSNVIKWGFSLRVVFRCSCYSTGSMHRSGLQVISAVRVLFKIIGILKLIFYLTHCV